MSRSTPRTLLAVAIVLAGCSDSATKPKSDPTATTTSGTTVSSGAATSTSSTVPATKPVAIAAVVPTYADAERAFRRGHYEEAAGMFATYTEHEPDNAWGQYMLGLSSWKIGQHARALEAFDAALRLDPSHRKSLLNSARVLLETARPQDALERVDRALAIEPLSAEGLRLKGRALYELGRYDEAIDAYQRGLALDDRDVWAMNNLGYLYIQQGRSDEALRPLARAVELRGNVPVFQNNFGTALERTGDFVAASEAYRAALAADSTYDKAAVGLERVTVHGAQSDSSTVDVAALSREFQEQIEQWRTRSARADSAGVTQPATPTDSATTGMVRDSTPQ
jgi:tetratricopeptide (TPR) repeat protein